MQKQLDKRKEKDAETSIILHFTSPQEQGEVCLFLHKSPE